MFRSNPPGFHTALTPELHQTIIENVKHVITPRQVARMSRILDKNLFNWLKRGYEEASREENTIFAQLFLDFEQKLGEVVKEFIETLRNRETNWQATYELLKVAARDDFGCDVTEFKELKEMYAKLFEDFKRMTEQQGLNVTKGDSNNG